MKIASIDGEPLPGTQCGRLLTNAEWIQLATGNHKIEAAYFRPDRGNTYVSSTHNIAHNFNLKPGVNEIKSTEEGQKKWLFEPYTGNWDFGVYRGFDTIPAVETNK